MPVLRWTVAVDNSRGAWRTTELTHIDRCRRLGSKLPIARDQQQPDRQHPGPAPNSGVRPAAAAGKFQVSVQLGSWNKNEFPARRRCAAGRTGQS